MSSSTNSPSSTSLISQARRLIPPLAADRHKGQAGRVCVVGGSRDYTGAPFFASMSSMLFGADMTFTLCHPDAGATIKTYSPDLIVQRVLDEQQGLDALRKHLEGLFPRVHALVLGPGLGRDDFMQEAASVVIQMAREKNVYMVIDADGLWLLQNRPELLRGYTRAVITPNVMEFSRLCQAVKIDAKAPDATLELARALQGPTVLHKGRIDTITDGTDVVHCDVEGGLKRCGGQGDILAGCLGTFAAWCSIYEAEHSQPRLIHAAYGAAVTARTCSRLAFKEKRRAMLAHDLLQHVGSAYEQLFANDDV